MKRLHLFGRRRSRRKSGPGGLLAFLLLLLPAGLYLRDAGPDWSQFLPRHQGSDFARPGAWSVYFSPHGGATDAIVGEISRAKKKIRVQSYSFTSAPIAKALAEAHNRGIDVRVILDKSQRSERYTSATYLVNRKVPVWIDAAHAIAHDKVIILDGSTVITGSFNFTQAAEKRNSENLLILREAPDLAAKYEAHWERHVAHSQPYERPAPTPSRHSLRPF